ncbi:hypothetical protein D6774_01110 [Candidatus Woesearchaeota archaeon]|jgi:flagellin-like protein|nr:MAG: hypothetical protein D6774_01110 [Candidatus Woesearchaeota archaeon]
MNSKGVSPLAATLLLIVFAVALGILTMTLGGSYLDEKASSPRFIEGCVVVPLEENSFTLPVRVYGETGSVEQEAICTIPPVALDNPLKVAVQS